ncbi:hypothetical protein QFC19_001920 [Naganishia cerealis]|uniref:Uncharacterized protein n=1 Tax=Naganishia cerealis TaxID=610337 RepID=A0ACC2WD52_9TREE|nr:hypothetical protein QFC19_001920 [Naganishia cerealis]
MAEGMKTPGSTMAWNSAHDGNDADTPMTRTPPSSARRTLNSKLDDAGLSPTQGRGREDPHQRRQASEQEMSAAEALSALAGTPSASRMAEFQQAGDANTLPTDVGHAGPEGNMVDALKQDDLISPKTTPVAEEPPKKRKRVTKVVAGDGMTEPEKSEKPKQSVAGRKRKASVQEPASGENASIDTPASKGTSNGKGRKRITKDTQNDATPPETQQLVPSAYNPKRILEANTVLQPITQDELAYIRNPRNIKNPLKTGRPTKFPQATQQPSPYGRDLHPSGHSDRPPSEAGNSYFASAETSTGTANSQATHGPRSQIRQLGRGDSDNHSSADRSVSGAKRARDGMNDALQGVDGRPWANRDDGGLQASKRAKVSGDRGKGYEVAEHYNKRGNQGRDNRKDSAIIGLRSCNNWIKAVMIQTYVRRRPDRQWISRDPNGRVLDLGCGKGGDIAKWDRANIQEYQSITELPREVLSKGFDNVSMQFCIHYAFERVQNVRQMLENVAMYLREGGIYFGTTVSKDKIVSALNEIPPESKDLVIANDYFKMEFTEREHDGKFGHAYRFSLTDAIDDCEEYVVDWNEFTSIAAEYKLKCIYRKDFDEMFEEHTQNREFLAMAERMQVVDEQGDLYMDAGQWAAVSMYLGFAFEKMPMSWNLLREAQSGAAPGDVAS